MMMGISTFKMVYKSHDDHMQRKIAKMCYTESAEND